MGLYPRAKVNTFLPPFICFNQYHSHSLFLRIYLFSIRTTDWENLDNLTPLMEIRSEKKFIWNRWVISDHIHTYYLFCICVCVLTWLKISWTWRLYREILLISSLQSHYLNRWRSFKFWNELCYLFSYKFVPADLSLKFWFSSFSYISSWKTWFPWVYLLSTGEMARMIWKLWPTWTDCWGQMGCSIVVHD